MPSSSRRALKKLGWAEGTEKQIRETPGLRKLRTKSEKHRLRLDYMSSKMSSVRDAAASGR
jgi:hypothetical protein